jgi:hypothetical protein
MTTDFGRGMYEDIAATAYPPNVAAEILNGRIKPDGTVTRRSGTQRTHPTSLETGDGFGAIRHFTAAGVEQLLVFINDRSFRSEDDGATWLDVTPADEGQGGATSQLATGYWDFAQMRVGATNWTFASNGDVQLWRWDGTDWTATPNAPSGIKFCEVFNGRLWVSGHSGALLQASKIADPTVWASPDGLTIQILTHSGVVPSGLFQLGPHLLVFDKGSTSYVDGYGEQTIIVASGATGFSRSVGCIAFRTIVGVGDNAVCWLSDRGVEYYQPGSPITLLSRGVTEFMESLDRISLEGTPGRASAVYHQFPQEYHLALATAGARNNRILVINLLQRGRGWIGAPAVDRWNTAAGNQGTELLFGVDASGYLQTTGGGFELVSDSDGYASQAGVAGGDPTVEDNDNYLDTVTNDALPSTLFLGPEVNQVTAVHSVGYDGFVRIHETTGDKDDALSDGTGGVDLTLTLVTRPFLFKRPTHRKRVRAVHVGVIGAAVSTITTLLRTRGMNGVERTIAFPATAYNQSIRKRHMNYAVGDAPQVEIRTTDPIRISEAGVSAEIMREREV